MKKKLFILFVLIIILLYLDNIYFFVVRQFYPLRYEQSIGYYANQFNVDPFLICAIIKAESNFKKNVISNKGAIGLMQLTPKTAEWVCKQIKHKYNYNELFNPDINILIGSWYIKYLINYYNNDIKLAVAAYNGGMANVNKWIKANNAITIEPGDIPFKETSHFVKRVFKNYEIYKKLYKTSFKDFY